jgi:Mannosyltransferase (PIG-V)
MNSVVARPAGSVGTAVAADAGSGGAPGPGPGLFDRVAWRDAALIWAIQHALLVAITYVGGSLILIPSYSDRRLPWSSLLHPWVTWDADIYARIAREGYDKFWLTRFFPLLPALEHVLSPLAAGNPAAAGVLISNVACLGAFGVVRVLAERELGREAARRSVLYLALFPTSFFFAAGYPEALFVLLSAASFLTLRRGRWVTAGALAGMAALARPVGVLLVVPIAVEALQRVRAGKLRPGSRQIVPVLVGLALPVAAVAGFSYYLSRRFGTLTAIAQAQNADGAPGSGKGLTWPWVGFLRAGRALVQSGFDPNFHQVHILLDAGFTLALIALTIATFRRLPLPYVLYAWAVLALLICTPGHNWYALYSNMRFTLEVIPLFMLLGRWGESRTFERALLLAFLPLLALLTLTFVTGGWVA